MKRIFILIFILSTVTSFAQAQSIYDIRDAMDFFKQNKMLTSDSNGKIQESDIEGSPYLNDTFIIGTIYTKQKLQYNNLPLRYNIYNDELEFRTPENQVLALTAPEIVEKVEFGDYTLSYIPFITTKKMKRSFFQVLIDNEVSLYKRSNITFKAPTEAAAYKEPEPAKFIKKTDTYYIRIGQEAALKVGSKNDVINMFTDHKEEIAAFIKKNKIKINKPEELFKLIEHANTL